MTIKELYNKHATVKIDKSFADKTHRYLIAIMSKDEENMEWFNTFYFGVNKIRFTDVDKENMFLLLDIDEMEFRRDIKSLDGIKSSWKVVTDPFNLSVALYLRKILESDLREDLKRRAYIDLAIVLQFKFITSMYSAYLDYQVTKDIATTVYERLPRKFLIKKLGSNYKVLEDKAIQRYEDKKWRDVLFRDKPAKFVYYISNINTATKSFVLEQYSVLVQVKEEDEIRKTTSPTIRDGETGEERIREINNIHNAYVESIKRKIYIKDDFIDLELLEVVSQLFPRIKIDAVRETLEHIHNQAFKDPDMVDMCIKIIEINNRYLYVEKMFPPYADRLISVFKFLKNYWSSSSLKDKDMKEVKNKIISMVKEITGIKTKGVLSSTTIIVAVYIYTISITDIKR